MLSIASGTLQQAGGCKWCRRSVEAAEADSLAQIDAQLLYVSRNKVAAALAEKGGSNGLAKTARTLVQFVEGEFEDV